ncbi:PREDICTED: kelch domain-containing protein 2-like isoform X2 [Amphimedon queenslandica]|uniref:Uncharacterized protein n=1 Tax=Amphimedon queenslandica TaxID=400682 RepID=A0AAN0JP47_AMPQE|nr:PREDICTED: kelch domain-containing protein 2-like isoform X2 [Amphimedon queenslandica]|eukprot:XP_019858593.1 PREDICTED: kelch domain-containing protein 2-like isoform X2 [Amphimedon queenslandica]
MEGACACTINEMVYILCGRDSSTLESPTSFKIRTLNTDTHQWSQLLTEGDTPSFTACSTCVLIGHCIYTFGGWARGIVTNDVHQYNITSQSWRELEPTDRSHEPMMKNKHGMVTHGNALLIFGGYGCPKVGSKFQEGAGYVFDVQSLLSTLMWTNELHLFDIEERKWVEPVITGPRPKPCAAFSFNRIDTDRVVLFGGRQKEERVNELHILDTSNWCWSGVLLPEGPDDVWPSKRSFHSASTVFDPQLINNNDNKGLNEQHLLVLWGNDNDGEIVSDCWILEIKGKETQHDNSHHYKWRRFQFPVPVRGRTWQSTASVYNTPSVGETLLVTVGGSFENIFINEDPLMADSTIIMRFAILLFYRLSFFTKIVSLICVEDVS